MNRFSILSLIFMNAVLISCTFSSQPETQHSSYKDELRYPIVSDSTTTVQTIYGRIQGYKDGDIYTFKGIPYAKAERFMPPQFPDKFRGTKVCRIYGPKAPQTSTTLNWNPGYNDYHLGFQFNLEPVDEKNCLVLNIWTKGLDDKKKRPVFVWIHGGGFTSGSANDLPCYEGYSLAQKGDIVVVSVNHRLNLLGYIDLRGLGGAFSESVNLGMQDLIKCLEWIQTNITRFGGDPTNVTIAGQSGGGGKVNTLLAMPFAQGLYHKAIVQSGSWILHNSDEVGKRLGLKVIEELGIKNPAPQVLSEIPYEKLVKAGERAISKMNRELILKNLPGNISFCPTIDGKYLINPSFDPEAPDISKQIPMIIGSNKNEFAYNTNQPIPIDKVKSMLAQKYEATQVNKFIDAFEQVYPDHNPEDMIYTDLFLRPNVVKQGNAKSAQKAAPVYMYFFTWKPSVNALGACHGMELPFIFNNISLQREMTGATPDAYQLAELMSAAWISFIKTGNPNITGLPKWEPYTQESGTTMIFDNNCRIVHHHDQPLMQFKTEHPF